MKQRLFLCSDLGTSSLKAALIDNAGHLHGFERIKYTDITTVYGADVWLDAFYRAVCRLEASLSAGLTAVSALCISGSGPTLVPVCGDTPESLRPIYWYDPVPALKDPLLLGKKTRSLFLPRLKGYLNKKAGKNTRTQYFFSPHEWLSWKLGARPVTILPHNEYIPYYWDSEQCSMFKINLEWFPPFVRMGELIGTLHSVTSNKNSSAAKLLVPGVPIIAGAADFIMALIGTGTLKPGTACDRTGSSEGINFCAKAIPELHSGELRILPHAVPGLFNIGAIIPQSGILFDQYRSSSGQEGKDYHELTREIFAHPDHPGKKVLETIGSSFVKALDDLQNAGFNIKELVLSGGQCADPLWNRYKATISGRTLKVPEIIHAELAGNAVLCEAAFSGKSIQETVAKMFRIKETYSP